MLKEIKFGEIVEGVSNCCITANCILNDDVSEKIRQSIELF